MAVAFDEMNGPDGDLRPAYQELSPLAGPRRRRTPWDIAARRRNCCSAGSAITFAVYGDAEAQERLIPFDVIPRIISAKEGGSSKKA